MTLKFKEEYYEEKWHEGDYWYRRSPRDVWYKFNYEMLLAKLIETEVQLSSAEDEIQDLHYQESMNNCDYTCMTEGCDCFDN